MARISAPLFAFGDSEPLGTTDDYVRNAAPAGELSLSGPSARPDGRTIPVRGDLAHIRLAGVHFVPHYAVPMPRRASSDGAQLRLAASPDAEVLTNLGRGEVFNVLDIADGWAWGQLGEDGFVGYVPLDALEAA